MPVPFKSRRLASAGAFLIVSIAGSLPAEGPASSAGSGAPDAPQALAAGAVAPAFEAAAADGGTLALASLRGRVVLLNFWGIACPPCRIEMPELQKIHRRYSARGLAVIGIEEMNASADDARRFAAGIGVRYPILLDPGERIGRLYRLEAHPTTVVIDRQGRVAWITAGYLRGDEHEIEQAVLDALAAPERP